MVTGIDRGATRKDWRGGLDGIDMLLLPILGLVVKKCGWKKEELRKLQEMLFLLHLPSVVFNHAKKKTVPQ